jgi:4-hydroxyacetophenone monooxygenase
MAAALVGASPHGVRSQPMALSSSPLPLPADDAVIERALEGAELTALLAAVAHITGRDETLDDALRPDPARMREPQAGYTPDQQAAARRACLDGLRRFRDEQQGVVARPDDARLRTLMDFCTGTSVDPRYVPLLIEELAIDGDELRAPQWAKADIAPERTFNAVIIGAGMSGLAAAHRLQQAGVEFAVIEKNDDVGGTWLENSYPGCRVDVQNHMYSYSFAQRHDWPYYFSPRPVLRDYFRECAEEFGLMEHIRFRTEVISCVWTEEANRWVLAVRNPDGTEDTMTANAVISAVGQLNRPLTPTISGQDSFAGASFHSAQWDHNVDLAGKRVAVIGTGASACQFIPIVAREAARLDVYQRTAPWLIPAPRYQEPVDPGFSLLLTHVPFYAQWYRFFMFWRGAEGMLAAATVDPAFPPTERSVSAANEVFRELLTQWIAFCAGDDDELLAKMTPNYPPLSKRFIVDDGTWATTLKQDHVDLVTTPIEAIEPGGVRTLDGTVRAADVVIYGTGFQAARFLTPMQVVGRGGVDLHDQWNGDARAYLGIVAPNFPNFFFLYGPNTNIVVNGSIIYFSECEVHYVTECVRFLLESGSASLDCRADVHDRYNEVIDAANKLRTWGFSNVSSWYKNQYGRSAQNWPFSVLEFWEQTRAPDPADFHITVGSQG